MNEKEIQDKLIAKSGVKSVRLSKNISYSYNETAKTLTLQLLPSAIGYEKKNSSTSNMQSDEACFEAWALVFHVHLGWKCQLEIPEEAKLKDLKRYEGHYNRFLYRAMKFSEQYSDWFSLSEGLQNKVGRFRDEIYGKTGKQYCNNIPKKAAGVNDHLEEIIESYFADNHLVLKGLVKESVPSIDLETVYRQLPVGLFEKTINKPCGESRIFTGGKSAIDLWGTTERNNEIAIFELKANNKMLGIITELMFYANYMSDMYCQEKNNWEPLPLGREKDFRGYRALIEKKQIERIYAYMLTDALHPLITDEVIKEMNNDSGKIHYNSIVYSYKMNIGKKPCASIS